MILFVKTWDQTSSFKIFNSCSIIEKISLGNYHYQMPGDTRFEKISNGKNNF